MRPASDGAVKRIDFLFDTEYAINGEPVERRLEVRKEFSAPVLADVLDRIADTPQNRLDELLPSNWARQTKLDQAA